MSDATAVVVTEDVTHVVIEGTLTQVVLTDETSVVSTSEAGPQGIPGPVGIYIGDTPPSNTTILWVDTS